MKEVVLPKLWVLILGILSAFLFPPIGIIWGIFLLIKKYRSVGIALIGTAIVSMAIGAFIIYNDLISKKEELLTNGYPLFDKGEILPKEFRNLQLKELQIQEISGLFEESLGKMDPY